MKNLIALKKAPLSSSARSGDFTYIPIIFHLVANSDGEGRIRIESVLDQLCALNENFEPLKIKFYLKNSEVRSLNDNTIYSNPASAAGSTKISLEKNKSGANGINIFITDNADTGSEGTTLGYYSPSQDVIVLKKSIVQNDTQRKFVLAHEMGHFFSLPHTFNGWDQEPWDGTPVTQANSPGGILSELADSSNCEIAGDMICDTPADYNLGFGWDGCRDYDGGCADISGQLLAPDESNFMGYFLGCDDYYFSEMQKEIILKDYDTGRRAYLRVNYMPNDVSITESPSVVGPADNSTTTFYNSVELSWSPVENASHYLIELTQGLFKFYYTTDETKLFLTDLKEDKAYRWMVKPYSDVYTCADFSESFSFRTGTMTTSTNQIELGDEINIFPNPNKGNNLNIDLNNVVSDYVNYEIIDINGSRLFSGILNKQITEISNLNLIPGFYLIKFTQENVQFYKKFIVNE
ncbi:hypothetical protein GCM10007940_09800 [Portibacter lacus]|uniref:Fibronectin type-III domain-containing protein n=2 Tax=Portibacter lacus TaxID=1099794 RepID=A0AA37WEQ7_9BACT|nr:hypothetical protein GCM10007940_09800 [Portibacter lacus]